MGKKLSTEEFIKRAKEVHGDKYDYSNSIYVNSHTKIEFYCKEHRTFFKQTPNKHLLHRGCKKCAFTKLNSNSFINKAKQIHGDKYDYSLVKYVNARSKVKIICKKHGVFEQTPNNHLQGKGCKKCAILLHANNRTMTTEEFIEKAKQIHGDKYDYSLVEYTKYLNFVKIICKEHGVFQQKANNHLQGHGCMKCGGKQHRDTISFIEKAKQIHGDKYDYSLVEYINDKTNVKIICKNHGVFDQRPNNHLQGKGCSLCVGSFPEQILSDYLKNKKIESSYNHIFEDCINPKSNHKLKFDFYLPAYNTCIEYDGLQHFQEIDCWDVRDSLEDRQYRDNIKTEYCKNKGIRLIRLSKIEEIDNLISILNTPEFPSL